MIEPTPRYMFFTGKGVVGITSLARTTAVELAAAGRRVLLVRTDQVSNLTDVLDCPVHDTIQLVKGTQRLFIININPEKAAEAYRNRVTQPLEEFASPGAIVKIREVLSGACTTEIDSFDEFSRFVSGETDGTQNDVIIFETAPTGHKLRLLELPAAWSSFTDENPDGASCLGPKSALKLGKEGFHTVVSRLHDASLTQYNIVTRADKASLKEASRASTELKAPGMENQQLYINGEFHALDTSDELATKIEAMGDEQLQTISDNLKALPLKKSPLLPYNILRVEKLSSLFDGELQKSIATKQSPSSAAVSIHLKDISELTNELCANRSIKNI